MRGTSRTIFCALAALLLAGCSDMPDMRTAKVAYRAKDYETSAAHYRRLAEFGLPAAQVELGKLYLAGKGVEQNPEAALALFERAEKSGRDEKAAKNVVAAKTQVGVAALRDKVRGYTPEQGIALLKESAESGDARALFELGNAYEKGLGVAPDTRTAVSYYEQASALGYGKADYSLAAIYEKGKLLRQDPAKAAALYKTAADKGYERANLNLAKIYEKGLGVTADPGLAREYRRKAELANARSQNNL